MRPAQRPAIAPPLPPALRPGRASGEGALGTALHPGIQHPGGDEGDQHGGRDAAEKSFHETGVLLAMAWPGPSYGAAAPLRKRTSASASSSGVLALKKGSTGASGHSALAQPKRAVQRSILRSSAARAVRS